MLGLSQKNCKTFPLEKVENAFCSIYQHLLLVFIFDKFFALSRRDYFHSSFPLPDRSARASFLLEWHLKNLVRTISGMGGWGLAPSSATESTASNWIRIYCLRTPFSAGHDKAKVWKSKERKPFLALLNRHAHQDSTTVDQQHIPLSDTGWNMYRWASDINRGWNM